MSGVTIQLYEVGTIWDDSPAIPLLSPAAGADANGDFNRELPSREKILLASPLLGLKTSETTLTVRQIKSTFPHFI